MKLNLGAADRHIDGYLCVDIAPPPCKECDGYEGWQDGISGVGLARTRQVNLNWREWPWIDDQIDEVLAYDVAEHVDDRIHFMNELWRILKPGGRATIEVPDASRGVGFWQDPTHVTPWCKSTFAYFTVDKFAYARLHGAYGIRAAFKVLSLEDLPKSCGEDGREQVYKIRAVLEAVK